MQSNNNYANLSDEEVIKLVLKNQEIFSCLIERYENKLLRYIGRITNLSPDDQEDVLQEIFIKVYKNLNDFDTDLKFSSWIYRIAHNEIISNFRKRKRRPEYTPGEENEVLLKNIISEINLEKDLDTEYLKENIYKILDKIDEKYKEVLILKYFESKDYKEISDILKKPMGTVATLLNRAKQEFQKELKIQKLKLL
jgi:RNA polymerase sigma-70 factor (ECF subfamily)